VVKEAADELFGGHCGCHRCFGFGVMVAERDAAIFEGEDVSVADSDAKDVGSQIFQGSFAAADGDDVHDPVLLPDVRRDLIEESGLLEEVAELGPEYLRQGFFRQEVVVSGRSPGAVGRQPACGDQVVHMGVISQIARPGLQDADHAEGASDVFRIGGQLLQGLLRSLKEPVVDDLLSPAGKAPQTLRQREGGHEVGGEQEQVSLLIDPAIDLIVLTLRTMAILAGVIPVMLLAALGAAVYMAAQGLRATVADVLYGPPVAGKQPVLALGEIFRAVQAKDVRQLRHTHFTGPP